jgi:hypothetical protein
MSSLWIPRELKVAPYLDPGIRPPALQPRSALLINPFYPKDPHASFGKHVLTPSLALTSIAGVTPPSPRRLSTTAYVSRAVGGGLCLVLPAAVLAPIDLAPSPGGSACRSALPGDVLSVQAFESSVALADSAPSHRHGLASSRRVDAPPPRLYSPSLSACAREATCWPSGNGPDGRRLRPFRSDPPRPMAGGLHR